MWSKRISDCNDDMPAQGLRVCVDKYHNSNEHRRKALQISMISKFVPFPGWVFPDSWHMLPDASDHPIISWPLSYLLKNHMSPILRCNPLEQTLENRTAIDHMMTASWANKSFALDWHTFTQASSRSQTYQGSFSFLMGRTPILRFICSPRVKKEIFGNDQNSRCGIRFLHLLWHCHGVARHNTDCISGQMFQ
jgi:hypothetical protein